MCACVCVCVCVCVCIFTILGDFDFYLHLTPKIQSEVSAEFSMHEILRR